MKHIAQVSLLMVLSAACTDAGEPTDARNNTTAPRMSVTADDGRAAALKKMTAVAPDFTNNVDGGAEVVHAVLCSNLSGSVFVRQQCHENEQQLDPVALGLVGPQGPAGPPGPSGISGYQIVTHQESLSPSTIANVHVECPIGKRVLGGGFEIETPTDVRVFSSEPSDGDGNLIDHGWNALVQNAGSSSRQTTVTAICASA